MTTTWTSCDNGCPGAFPAGTECPRCDRIDLSVESGRQFRTIELLEQNNRLLRETNRLLEIISRKL